MADATAIVFTLADATARSYVESFCLWEGGWINPRKRTKDCAEDVSNALRYFKLRGSALPYRVIRSHSGKRWMLRFEDKA